MGALFAEYQPESHGNAVAIDIRRLDLEVLDDCAAVVAQREGGDPAGWRAALERSLEASDRITLVGLVEGEVAGYATTAWLAPGSDGPESVAPAGWYLLGLVIGPRFRRCGVGRALTAARLRWLRTRTDRVWYFVSSENRPSIALHAEFGFRRVATDLHFPGVSFTGTGLLYSTVLTDLGPLG